MMFQKKVSIIIKHGYFATGHVIGLNISPTAECQRLLRNYKLLFKSTEDGAAIFKDKAGIADNLPAANTAFDFLLLLDDVQFLKYTNLPSKKTDETYLFSCKKGKTVLQISTTPKLQSFYNGATTILGVLRLNFNLSAEATFTVNFTAPQLKWRYYVLTSATFPDPVIDGTDPKTPFNIQTEADQIKRDLAKSYSEAIISVFESDEEIPVINSGRKNIQLKKMGSKAIVINHLPNPGPGDNGIKIINLLN